MWKSNDLSIRLRRQEAGSGKNLVVCLIWEYNQILPVLELVQVRNSAKNGQKIPYVKHLFDTLSEVHKGPVEPTKSFIQVHQTWTLPLWKKRGASEGFFQVQIYQAQRKKSFFKKILVSMEYWRNFFLLDHDTCHHLHFFSITGVYVHISVVIVLEFHNVSGKIQYISIS